MFHNTKNVFADDENLSNGVENISRTIPSKKICYNKKRNKYRIYQCHSRVFGVYPQPKVDAVAKFPKITKHSSLPYLIKNVKNLVQASKSDIMLEKSSQPFRVGFIVNLMQEYELQEFKEPFFNPFIQKRWKIYRCQLNTQEESCCCSCNSDAMFEVMKSLYDCYKKKNCDHCNCILCGHLPREERRLGEIRKSVTKVGVGVETLSAKERKEKGKTAEKVLSDKAKSSSEKEKVLEQMAQEGIPLPEGKTVSQKDLVKKVKIKHGVVSTKAASVKAVTPEKLREAGLLTPLEGKSPEKKEQILKRLVSAGIPMPEAKTASEKKIISKVRMDMGLPPEPKSSAEKEKYKKAMAAGVVTPLAGKSVAQKEKIFKSQAEIGLPLPEGKTSSEKALIAKVKASVRPPSEGRKREELSEKLKKTKAVGLMTPLTSKAPEQREKIVRGLAMQGLPLPEARSPSETRLINKVRLDLGLPPEPKTASEKDKYLSALNQGLMVPLEGKSPVQKEKILQDIFDLGIKLPVGRTPSEKNLVAKVQAATRSPPAPVAEKIKKAKTTGLLTPVSGKSPEQKEKILRGLAMQGLPLPEAKSPSEVKLINKIRIDLGLPPIPRTPSEKVKYQDALDQGLIVPLEGKSPAQKEKILQSLIDLGIQLPEGRTPSEKSLIAKVKTRGPAPQVTVSEKFKKAKATGLLTPLTGKSPEQKENIIKGLAQQGVPLPKAKTPSEAKLISKIRLDLGVPPESEGRSPSEKALTDKIRAETSPTVRKKTKSRATMAVLSGRPPMPAEEAKVLNERTAKIMKEGKGPADECICDVLTPEKDRKVTGIRTRLPSGKVPSRITSEKLKAAKAAGLLTPLEGKTADQKSRILKGLAKSGLPLPEGKTASEKKIIDKVRTELGLPPEPKSQAQKEKYSKVQAAGFITPLEGKTPAQKEKILKSQAQMGIPLPEARTPSEKELIKKVKADIEVPSVVPSITGMTSEKIKKAKAAGLLAPLEGKTPEEKEKVLKARVAAGLPLPEGRTDSDKQLIKKIKSATGYISPEGRTPSEKAKIRRVRRETGRLPTLVGKSPSHKEKILKSLAKQGLPLPEGATTSEKALVDKVKAEGKSSRVLSKKLKAAKAAGLLTPLEGKTPEQKEQIIRGLAKVGVPLPEGKTTSEKDLIQKVQKDVGLPPTPKTASLKEKYKSAQEMGIITPLEGKTPYQKEAILKKMKQAGIELPEGRTASEKSLVRKVKTAAVIAPSKKLRSVKAAGLLTPLEGKSPEQKEHIIRGLAKAGVPLPEGKTASEKSLIQKVQKDIGLPPTPKTSSLKEKYKKAQVAGILTPLEGKTPSQKEAVLKKMKEARIELPEGRTASEKSLIRQVKSGIPSKKLQAASGMLTPLEGRIKSAVSRRQPFVLPALPPEERSKLDEKTAKNIKESKGPVDECICGILTPELERISEKGRPPKKSKHLTGRLSTLAGKTPAEKEKTLRDMAMQGIGLPKGETVSEKKLIDNVRAEMGLPPEPKSASEKKKFDKAVAEGFIVPLEGKSDAEKEKILKTQATTGLPLPEGRSPSEKALIAKVKAETKARLSTVTKIPSEKLLKAKDEGLLTPLEGKPIAQKEKILKGLAEAGLPLPEGKTMSEKSLVSKIKPEYGVPPVAKTVSEKAIIKKAKAEGLFTPLTGKSPAEKERILKGLAEAGLPMPEGRTASEKSLLKKVRTSAGLPLEPTPSSKRRSIKTKTKKVGVGVGKLSAKRLSARARYTPPPGVTEEIEEIRKTTTCDRGCGCDKKKIKFKHSYIKIKVTSPDISSLCPCPEECIPGVKGGIFTDSEGIKVTVGRAVGLTSFFMNHSKNLRQINIENVNHRDHVTLRDNSFSKDSCIQLPAVFDSDLIKRKLLQELLRVNYNYEELTSRHHIQSNPNITSISTIEKTSPKESRSYFSSTSDSSIYTKRNCNTDISNCSSNESVMVIRTESSLIFSTSYEGSNSSRTISIISLIDSSFSSHSAKYLCYSKTEDSFSDISAEEIEYLTKEIDYSTVDTIESYISTPPFSNITHSETKKNVECTSQNEIIVFRMSASNTTEDNNNQYYSKCRKDEVDDSRNSNYINSKPIFLINYLDSDNDIKEVVDQILSQKLAEDTSSIFVVVPTSDECDSDTSHKPFSSSLCINMSKTFPKFNKVVKNNEEYAVSSPLPNISQGLKLYTKGKAISAEHPAKELHSKECNLDNKLQSNGLVQQDKFVNKENYAIINIEKRKNDLKQGKSKVECKSIETGDESLNKCPTSNKIEYSSRNTHCGQKDNYENIQSKPSQAFTKKPIIARKENIVNNTCGRGRTKCRNIYCQANLRLKPPSVSIRGVSMDTTEDRPCCCVPNMPATKNYLIDHCVASVMSEIITPLITDQGVLQGLSPTKYLLSEINHNSPSAMPNDSMPVGICHIPPCSGYKNCHDPKNPVRWALDPCGAVQEKHYEGSINQPCNCSPELMGMLMSAKDRKTIGVGGSNEFTEKKASGKKKVKMSEETPASPAPLNTGQASLKANIMTPTLKTDAEECNKCGLPLPKRGKKGKRKPCPCEQHAPPDVPPSADEVSKNDRSTRLNADAETATDNKKLKKSKRSKNKIEPCQCKKEEPETSDDEDPYIWIDETQMRKMKSDLTHMTSGFKVKAKKRPPKSPPPEPEPLMTLAEALMYLEAYASLSESNEEVSDGSGKDNKKKRKKKKKGKDVQCDCPAKPEIVSEMEPDPELETEEQLKGFKFTIGGKGSGSKGLSGVCCFDLIGSTNFLVTAPVFSTSETK